MKDIKYAVFNRDGQGGIHQEITIIAVLKKVR